MSTHQQVPTPALKTLTLALDGITTKRLVVTTARALASNGLRKSKKTVPSLRSGYGAVQPHGEGLVQGRVQGGKSSLVSGRQRAEWSGRAAACRSARAANGYDRLSVLFPSIVVPAVVVVVVVSAVVDLSGVLCPGFDSRVALWEGGDDAGHGNGGDERDDGFVEQHCDECFMKEVIVF